MHRPELDAISVEFGDVGQIVRMFDQICVMLTNAEGVRPNSLRSDFAIYAAIPSNVARVCPNRRRRLKDASRASLSHLPERLAANLSRHPTARTLANQIADYWATSAEPADIVPSQIVDTIDSPTFERELNNVAATAPPRQEHADRGRHWLNSPMMLPSCSCPVESSPTSATRNPSGVGPYFTRNIETTPGLTKIFRHPPTASPN